MAGMKDKFSFSALFGAMLIVLALNALLMIFGAQMPMWIEDRDLPKLLALLLIIPGAITGGVVFRLARTDELTFWAGAFTGATFQLFMWMLLPGYNR